MVWLILRSSHQGEKDIYFILFKYFFYNKATTVLTIYYLEYSF